MRRRWKVGDGFLAVLASIWFFGWLPPFIAIWAIGAPDGMNYNGDYVPALIFLAVWFGIVVVPALFVGAGMLLTVLWAERPRRITEPVLDDLRQRVTDE